MSTDTCSRTPHHSRRQSLWFIGAICLSFVMVQLDVSVVNVGLNALRQTYAAAVSDLTWVINTYALAFASLLLSSGAISDRFGTRNVFLTGLVLFMATSLACALSPTLPILELARIGQGIGAALLVPTSLTLLRHYYPNAQERGHAISLWATAGSLALATGPIIGGVLIDTLGWRSIFLINLPAGLLVLVIAARLAPAVGGKRGSLALSRQVLLIAALGSITLAFSESGSAGWQSPLTLGALAIGVLLLAAFIGLDRRSSVPVIPESLKHNRTVVATASIGFLCTSVFYGSIFMQSLFFQQSMAMTPSQTGLAFLPMMLSVTVATYYSGRLAQHFKVKNIVAIGGAMGLAGFAGLSFESPGQPLIGTMVPMMLIGAGTSMIVPGLANLIFSETPTRDAGSASALFSCARQMGGVIGVALFGSLLAGRELSESTDGIRMVCLVAIILVALWMTTGRWRLPR